MIFYYNYSSNLYSLFEIFYKNQISIFKMNQSDKVVISKLKKIAIISLIFMSI